MSKLQETLVCMSLALLLDGTLFFLMVYLPIIRPLNKKKKNGTA